MNDPTAYSFDSLASNSMKSKNPNSGCREVDVAKTLDTGSVDPSKNQGGIAIVQPTLVLNDQGGQQMSVSYDVTSTLRAEDHQHPPLVFSAGFSFGQSAKARSLGYQEEMSPTLRGGEGGNQKPCVLEVIEAIPIEHHPNDSRTKLSEDGVCQTLSSHMGTGGNNTPLVLESVIPFDTTQVTSPMNFSHPKPGDPCHPLASTAHPPTIAFTQNQREEVRDLNDVATAIGAESGTHQQTYVAVDVYNQEIDGNVSSTVTAATGGTNTSGPKVLCIGNGQADIGSHISEEVCQTLNCMHDQMAVMTAVDCRNATENTEVNGTLQAKEQGQNLNSNNVCRTGNTVRRLTPKECERLQAFPDNWTLIGEWVDSKGKVHREADTPRYKSLGNSIALPFWYWLLNRISAQYEGETPTLGSLFDGIGGFPLCWETINGKGTALWASEIEEFPIAVTKLRFPENEDGEDRSD